MIFLIVVNVNFCSDFSNKKKSRIMNKFFHH